jgi:hypothetical protein
MPAAEVPALAAAPMPPVAWMLPAAPAAPLIAPPEPPLPVAGVVVVVVVVERPPLPAAALAPLAAAGGLAPEPPLLLDAGVALVLPVPAAGVLLDAGVIEAGAWPDDVSLLPHAGKPQQMQAKTAARKPSLAVLGPCMAANSRMNCMWRHSPTLRWCSQPFLWRAVGARTIAESDARFLTNTSPRRLASSSRRQRASRAP